ncbi:TPA: dUTPase [Staphylococcus aureus]|uniref:Putative dUTPase n=9 Tax=Staphylococcus TaxID=1279 RepID=A0A1R3UDZ0_STAAU|nr:dUTPase [Staphylococcus aureus]NDP23904.1 dUTPase [Staphylococcus aureus]NDP31490.1 dUTPase [Staphylococcus aureus]NDP97130.1 dUTPase [Staphylococcus aureus]NDQ07784.1 dUTPase [Staphylococcus aureus]NDQ17967.1 dUTPase [Staphylococcus aureus]
MNNLTVDQLKELLQIQKEFDDRIPTLNLRDSKIAYVVEFFEWFNTLETFKNWKKKPGKPLDVQLDELADMLAFGLSITNQQETDEILINTIVDAIMKDNKSNGEFDFADFKITKIMIAGIGYTVLRSDTTSRAYTLALPFAIAIQYYTIDQLIDAYKKKMKRNHERQDGTADAGKGYV